MTITANYVDIENRSIYPAIVVVEDETIVSVSKTDKKVDNYILPGFIDAHIHIESSMMIPSQFARLAVRHGTVATVSDPHEIANVLGIEGIDFMIENGNSVNFKFHFGASSCVPATPFETSGSTLDAKDIETLLKTRELNHLGEVMAFPSVINGEKEMLAKIDAAKRLNIPVDGHAPSLSGEDLKKYIDAGISTDHESSTLQEAKEKLNLGMKILIRQGSAAKNFEALIPLIEDYYEDIMFCSDDRHPNDLLKEHINIMVSQAVKKGYDLFKVLKAACINPIEHYSLDVGCLREGDKADFIVVEDLENFNILSTVINGKTVFQNGKSDIETVEVNSLNNFKAEPISKDDIAFQSDCETIEVIQAIDHELLTKEFKYHNSKDGQFVSDIEDDILKIIVVNRYEKNSKPSVGFINGFGLKHGAIASSVAHDSHNIVAVGCTDEEIVKAVNTIIASKGGVCCVNSDEVVSLALNIAGIMNSGDGFETAKRYEKLDSYSKEVLGSILSAPFMTLSFMALLVIPELKLSDKGLFDGREFHFIPPCIEVP
ncbi:MAG: adenine deaminase [Campylobacterota bacterium]|nr:adenine deaminase [Campylobacterota bacterium]